MNYFSTYSLTFNPIFKIFYYLIWFLIIKLIKEKSISIEFHKVKAYSNNHYNNTIDTLVKADGPYLILNNITLKYQYNLYFYDNIVLIPSRHFVKDFL